MLAKLRTPDTHREGGGATWLPLSSRRPETTTFQPSSCSSQVLGDTWPIPVVDPVTSTTPLDMMLVSLGEKKERSVYFRYSD